MIAGCLLDRVNEV